MSELEPCPFCSDGGKPVAFVEPDGYQEHGGNVHRGYVGCRICGMGLELFRCDNEIPAEWWGEGDEEAPSGFLRHLVNVWNTRYDRTCQMIECRWGDGSCTWGCKCSDCGEKFEHTRGRTWSYCPNCGAEVVDD